LGTAQPFSSAKAVADWFGATTAESLMANVYFSGRNNATRKPAQLSFFQYNVAATTAYLRSSTFANLAEVQAITGVLTVDFDGVSNTSSSFNLSTATSFTDAASIIAAAFTSPNFIPSYDTQLGRFVFTGSTTGSTATVTFATGTAAAALKLTQATGAVLSQGADIATPTSSMDSVIANSQNWATFTTAFEPLLSDKLLFASWTNAQNNRYAYVSWDTDTAATIVPDTTSFMYNVKQANYSGVVGVYKDVLHAAFVLGVTASLDFGRHNGRTDYAFKYANGLVASVADLTTASNLEANGYNYVGEFATANQGFTFFYNGSVSGEYKFLDSYVNQIYLNSQLQLAMMSLLTDVNFVPYNSSGYALIHAASMDPINQMINYGGIVSGIPLSALQAADVNNAAGVEIDKTLSSRGWVLQILPATFWYTDGGSVQKITLSSIVVL